MPKPLPFRLPRALATALLVSLLGGCAALPVSTVGRQRGVTRTPEGMLDLRGVVHVHTQSSHDSLGTIEELIDGAKHAGVVWVALSEHTQPGGPAPSGTLEGILVIPGYELRAWNGSLLASRS